VNTESQYDLKLKGFLEKNIDKMKGFSDKYWFSF